jgi:hypothetical protein
MSSKKELAELEKLKKIKWLKLTKVRNICWKNFNGLEDFTSIQKTKKINLYFRIF